MLIQANYYPDGGDRDFLTLPSDVTLRRLTQLTRLRLRVGVSSASAARCAWLYTNIACACSYVLACCLLLSNIQLSTIAMCRTGIGGSASGCDNPAQHHESDTSGTAVCARFCRVCSWVSSWVWWPLRTHLHDLLQGELLRRRRWSFGSFAKSTYIGAGHLYTGAILRRGAAPGWAGGAEGARGGELRGAPGHCVPPACTACKPAHQLCCVRAGPLQLCRPESCMKTIYTLISMRGRSPFIRYPELLILWPVSGQGLRVYMLMQAAVVCSA